MLLDASRGRPWITGGRIYTESNNSGGTSSRNGFPSAHLSPACGIIDVEGLGPLDGDYTLVDELMEMNGIPGWSSASAGTPTFLLWWQMDQRVWTIRKHGLSTFHAFVEGAPDVPPSTSSRWQMYTCNQNVSVFEEVDHAVVSITCPGKLPAIYIVLDVNLKTVWYTSY